MNQILHGKQRLTEIEEKKIHITNLFA